MNFLFVGLGGAVGAMLRYAVGLIPFNGGFPFATLAVNAAGALLIGFITGFAGRRGMPDGLLLFLKTGVCGGFTTFSTFSLEAYTMLRGGRAGAAALYAALSLALCLAGVFAGALAAKKLA